MESATIRHHQLPSRSVTSLVMAIAMLVLGGLLFRAVRRQLSV